MKTREKFWEEKEEFRNYLSHINRDWRFLKGQLFLGGAFLIGMICFWLWIGK